MPYIKPNDKLRFAKELEELKSMVMTAGDLNYVITSICKNHLERKNETLCYSYLNEVIGVLECAKLEFYRRMVVPYEQLKIEENGDVY